jgi:acetyl-CoA carboxylase biotin carboxyl carrier protein
MEHRELKKLVQLMNENGLVELEIEEEGRRISLRKAGAVPTAGAMQMPMAMPMAPTQAAPVPDAGPPPGTKEILSPMVGTFYRRPSPDQDPYVDSGSRIDSETVVCIIEAMKVNNEIKAEMSGEIIEVLVEDGQPVEFDQPLFRVKS